jgi:hypothetical protein
VRGRVDGEEKGRYVAGCVLEGMPLLDVEGGARGRRGDVVGKGDSCEGGAALEGAGAERGEAGGEADSRERAAAGEGSVAYSVNTPVLRV